jgi:GntR family transcriptional regulator/MocR family aminotransferase
MITLPEDHSIPLYQALYQQLRSEIQSGDHAPGTKLPSKRKLASSLGISINTVDSAYSQLEAEGFLQSFPRRGFFVLDPGLLPEAQGALPEALPVPQPETRTYRVDFSPAGIPRAQFPFGTWRKLMKNCFNEYDARILLRTPPQGDYGLRQAVAQYLYRSRGVRCTPEQIVIGAGTDNLLLILGYILPNSFNLAVENPLYNRAHALFARLGHPVTAVPVSREGISLGDLPQEDRVAVYTTPSHQYPLGYAMPIGQRSALLRWSSQGEDRYIIEDDYDSEFRYQSKPIPSLQSIDPSGRVIYLGTFSRSVAPALRISYMVLPPQLLGQYLRDYQGYSSTVSGFEQAVLRQFMLEGHFETHVNRTRIYYKNRRQRLVEALSPLSPWMEVLGQPAGHHLTLSLKNGMDEKELVASGEAQGIRVYPVSPYFLGEVPQEYRSTVLLGFGGLTDAEIDTGAALLVRAWTPKGVAHES